MNLYISSFTKNGDKLADKLQLKLNCPTENRFLRTSGEKLEDWTKKAFSNGKAVIFVGAAGIAVRSIAAFLRGKDKDPAVIVCDELGRFVIPILSGHIGGANKLAVNIAELLGAQAVITTATDINGVWAADSWAAKKGYKVENPENIKYISSELLGGGKVGMISDISICDIMPENVISGDTSLECGIVVSPFLKKIYSKNLNIIPKCLCVGVGSKKNADENALIELFDKTAKQMNINKYSVKYVATIDIKQNEPSVLKLCEYLDAKPKIFSSDELKKADGIFTESDFVEKTVGVGNVCERSAVLASNGELIAKKTKGNGVTLAITFNTEVIP